jgi:hypothetical protein
MYKGHTPRGKKTTPPFGMTIGILWGPWLIDLVKGSCMTLAFPNMLRSPLLSWEINEVRTSLINFPEPIAAIGDLHKWSLTANGDFTVKSLWNSLRIPFPKVPWYHCVWFSGHIPKCSFITWIAI